MTLSAARHADALKAMAATLPAWQSAGMSDTGDRKIQSWRIVAGAYLHFIVPAYLIVVPLYCLFTARSGAGIGDLVRSAVPFSGWFLAGYAALALLSVAIAVVFEPLLQSRSRRREARDPRRAALASQQRVARAVADGRRLLGDRAATVLDSIRGPRWDHADPRFQALSTDLAEVVRASAAALASASPDRRPELMDMAAAALARIESALTALFAERGRLDEGDARTVARYVEMRYGQSDFSGDEP